MNMWKGHVVHIKWIVFLFFVENIRFVRAVHELFNVNTLELGAVLEIVATFGKVLRGLVRAVFVIVWLLQARRRAWNR